MARQQIELTESAQKERQPHGSKVKPQREIDTRDRERRERQDRLRLELVNHENNSKPSGPPSRSIYTKQALGENRAWPPPPGFVPRET
jgi:hypothetical protein